VVPEVGMVLPRPTNTHELTIAQNVDTLSKEGRLNVAAIHEIIATLNFTMTIPETKFLVSYIRMRMDNPIGIRHGPDLGRSCSGT
jgi:hypothetical protein